MLKTLLILLIFNPQKEADTIRFVNSAEIIQNAMEYNEAEDYQKSMDELTLVNHLDSNYWLVQARLIQTLDMAGRFEEALELGDSLLPTGTELPALFYLLFGNVYINQERYEEAIEIYSKGLKYFPYQRNLMYNIGYSYFVNEDFEKSLNILQDLLVINPYVGNAHQILGNIMSRMGNISKAALSYLIYLAINPEDNAALVRLNLILSDGFREEGSYASDYDNSLFEEYDQILRSKAAIDDRYKSEVDLEAPVAQQSELLINQLEYKEGTDDFWMDYYVPLFQKLSESELTAAYIYFILYSSENEKVLDWLKKNESKKDQAIQIGSAYLKSNRNTTEREILGESGDYSQWFYDDDVLKAIGKLENDIRVGPFEFFQPNERLEAIGFYNKEGLKEGEWKYFHDNGQLFYSEIRNDSGQVEGEVRTYSLRGNLMTTRVFKAGKLHGPFRSYFECGNLKEEYEYEDGEVNGELITYFKSGGIESRAMIKGNKRNGKQEVFYRSGKTFREFSNKDGLGEGPYVSYHPNGELFEKGELKENWRTGVWEIFYPDGKLEKKGKYSEGNKVGEWITYFPDGKKQFIKNFNSEGIPDGMITEFTESGQLWSEKKVDENKLVAYKYYGPEGNLLVEESNSKGNMPLKSFYPNGALSSEGTLERGYINGPVVYYYPNGNIKLKANIKDDKWHGPNEEFYESGELQGATTYVEGKIEGYFRGFYPNGNIEKEGWVVQGESQQKWKEYYPNGTLRNEYFYKDGSYHGENKFYDSKGRIAYTEIFYEAVPVGMKHFDTLGNIFQQFELDEKSSDLVIESLKGNKYLTKSYSCGENSSDILNFYSDGNLSSRFHVKNSQFQRFESFDLSGALLIEGEYLDNEPYGEWKYYDDNGKLMLSERYDAGLIDGQSISYYPNGVVESDCEFKKGDKHGKCEFYDQYGKLQIRRFYNNGIVGFQYSKKDGTNSDTIFIDNSKEDQQVISYFENGETAVIQTYSKGLIDGINMYFSINGDTVFYSERLNGRNHGPMRTFHKNGSLKEQSWFYWDLKHGLEKKYYEDGKLKEAVNWFYGTRDGWTKKYDRDGALILKTFYRIDSEY